MSELTVFNWFQVAWANLVCLPFGIWWGCYAAYKGYGFLRFIGVGLPMFVAVSVLPVAARFLFQH